jgi:hypothetical protein
MLYGQGSGNHASRLRSRTDISTPLALRLILGYARSAKMPSSRIRLFSSDR